MEKKIEVEINGKKLRIPEHMLSDMMKFGATQTRRNVREAPKELQKMEPKRIIIPPKELVKPVLNEIPKPVEIVPDLPVEVDPLPEMKVDATLPKPKNKGGRPKR